jgi:hypothetical protein
MFNNSTNINKMNNHILPEIIDYKKTMTYGIGNLVLDWNRHKNVVAVNRLVGFQAFPSW